MDGKSSVQMTLNQRLTFANLTCRLRAEAIHLGISLAEPPGDEAYHAGLVSTGCER